MCRIAGIVNKNLPNERIEPMVRSMCNILAHGGPDDEGIYSCSKHNLVLGNRRLALLDLSDNGHQPMSYADGNYHITYNGELYNFPELKTELSSKGFQFKSNSDTEVILASFSAWGTTSFQKFNGMFAFALFDDKNSTLYLVRDAVGIKPLYYSLTDKQLTFASEIKAFKNIPELQHENENWQVYMMAYGHLPEPVTTLQSVKPLPKGNYLKYDLANGKAQVISYHQFNYSETISDRSEAKQLIKDCLAKAVKRHLLSDAPIGVFLSGGLDSSLTALLANKEIKKHLNTLSLYFAETEYSEKRFQDVVLQRLHCNHHQHLLNEKEFHDLFPSIISDMDLPSTDGINTWFISKYAKETGLKAVLSGIGGDELFGGYPSFKRIYTVSNLEKIPKVLLRHSNISGVNKLRRLCYLTLGGIKGKYLFLRGHFIPREIANHLDISEKQVWDILEEQPVLNEMPTLSLQNQASWMEMNLYMQNQLLRDSDVMSMAHGVEIRVPFLDKEFITLALQMQSSTKYYGDFGKQLLIDSFKNILPEEIWNRKKMGFTFPFKNWLIKDELVKDTISSGKKSTKDNYKKFVDENLHWSQLMTLVLLEKHAKA
ncbi:MAG TPA: asparagine synthase (glutamine-hydrolyzing) [Chitinophagaceae bacterium]|nr:asparagine synthase (glutamine-hydrolyzing) [Chitinophagaceae bacterium]